MTSQRTLRVEAATASGLATDELLANRSRLLGEKGVEQRAADFGMLPERVLLHLALRGILQAAKLALELPIGGRTIDER